MPIEFSCSRCKTILRTPDDSAGKAARCPSCQNIERIPSRGELGASFPFDPQDAKSNPPYSGPDVSSTEGNPVGVRASLDFPDVGHIQTGSPYVSPQSSGSAPRVSRERIKAKITPAAISIIVVAAIKTMFWGVAVLVGFASIIDRGPRGDDVIGLVICSMVLLITIVVGIGAIRMLQMKNYTFCILSVVLLMLTGIPCCLIPTGIGIWALVVLLDPNAKQYFG